MDSAGEATPRTQSNGTFRPNNEAEYWPRFVADRRQVVLMDVLGTSSPVPYSSLREQALYRATTAKRRSEKNAAFRAALRASATSKLTRVPPGPEGRDPASTVGPHTAKKSSEDTQFVEPTTQRCADEVDAGAGHGEIVPNPGNTQRPHLEASCAASSSGDQPVGDFHHKTSKIQPHSQSQPEPPTSLGGPAQDASPPRIPPALTSLRGISVDKHPSQSSPPAAPSVLANLRGISSEPNSAPTCSSPAPPSHPRSLQGLAALGGISPARTQPNERGKPSPPPQPMQPVGTTPPPSRPDSPALHGRRGQNGVSSVSSPESPARAGTPRAGDSGPSGSPLQAAAKSAPRTVAAGASEPAQVIPEAAPTASVRQGTRDSVACPPVNGDPHGGPTVAGKLPALEPNREAPQGALAEGGLQPSPPSSVGTVTRRGGGNGDDDPTLSDAAWSRLFAAAKQMHVVLLAAEQLDPSMFEGIDPKATLAERLAYNSAQDAIADASECVQELCAAMAALPAHRLAARLRAAAAAAAVGPGGAATRSATGASTGSSHGEGASGTGGGKGAAAKRSKQQGSCDAGRGGRQGGADGGSCSCVEPGVAGNDGEGLVARLLNRALTLLIAGMVLVDSYRDDRAAICRLVKAAGLDERAARRLHCQLLMLADGILSYYGLPPMPYMELVALMGGLCMAHMEVSAPQSHHALEPDLLSAVPGCIASAAFLSRLVRHCNSIILVNRSKRSKRLDPAAQHRLRQQQQQPDEEDEGQRTGPRRSTEDGHGSNVGWLATTLEASVKHAVRIHVRAMLAAMAKRGGGGRAAARQSLREGYESVLGKKREEEEAQLLAASTPVGNCILEVLKSLPKWVDWSGQEQALGMSVAPAPATPAAGAGAARGDQPLAGVTCAVTHVVGLDTAVALGLSQEVEALEQPRIERPYDEPPCREELRVDLAHWVLAAAVDGQPRRAAGPTAASLHQIITLTALLSQLRVSSQPHPAAVPPSAHSTPDGPIVLAFERLPLPGASHDDDNPTTPPPAVPPSGQGAGRRGKRGDTAGRKGRPAKEEGQESSVLKGHGDGEAVRAVGPMEVTLVPCDASMCDRLQKQRRFALEARQRARRASATNPASAPRDFVIKVPMAGFDESEDEEEKRELQDRYEPDGPARRDSRCWYRQRLRDCLSRYGCAALSCRERGALHHAAELILQVQDDIRRESHPSGSTPLNGAISSSTSACCSSSPSSRSTPGLDVVPMPLSGGWDLRVRQACGGILKDLPLRPAAPVGGSPTLEDGWQEVRRLGLIREASRLLGLLEAEPGGPWQTHGSRPSGRAAVGNAGPPPAQGKKTGAAGGGGAGGRSRPKGGSSGGTAREGEQLSVSWWDEGVLLWVLRRPVHG